MKALIIILALVGVSFIGLLVYGGTRSEQPKKACEKVKNLNSKDGPDEDDMENWCPPSLAEATRPLQARFAPDLGIDPTELAAPTGLGTSSFPVDQSDKKMRAAHIELIAGDYAILKGGDTKLCLCREGAMNAKLFDDRCPGKWRQDHLLPKKGPPRTCLADDVRGIIPFSEDGGSIQFVEGPAAKVRIE